MTANEKLPDKSFGRIFYEAFLIATTIILLLVLITMLLPTFNSGHPMSKTAAARHNVSLLAMALAQYELDFGQPALWADKEVDYELDNASLIQTLTSDDAKYSPYLDVRVKEIRDGMYVDPWGRLITSLLTRTTTRRSRLEKWLHLAVLLSGPRAPIRLTIMGKRTT